MSCLCDRDIIVEQHDHGIVTPFDRDLVQPASYELTFDGSRVYRAKKLDLGLGSINCSYSVRDREFDAPLEWEPWEELFGGGLGMHYIMPGEFYIASSVERLAIPHHLMARFEGKSTLGRVGLMVHITAGYIDPGFNGTLTLEIANVAPWPIILQTGDKIGQLSFHKMSGAPSRPYGDAGNHYQGQVGPTLPR